MPIEAMVIQRRAGMETPPMDFVSVDSVVFAYTVIPQNEFCSIRLTNSFQQPPENLIRNKKPSLKKEKQPNHTQKYLLDPRRYGSDYDYSHMCLYQRERN